MSESIEYFFSENQTFNEEEIRFFNKCRNYFNEEEVALIKKAYIAARDLHQGQMRESKEPYITHPLRVAEILMEEMHLKDVASICAALLHDTIEDTGITEYFLSECFNEEIAELVEGVTKITNMNLGSKKEEDQMNNAIMLRKILSNPKIILIKLADRLHNMRTLEYKNNPNKQKNKALETISFFVPIAGIIGARNIKEELEDRCFKFLDPSDYKNIENMRTKHEVRHCKEFESLKVELEQVLKKANIDADIDMKTLNIYGISLGMRKYGRLKRIPKLTTFKIKVKTLSECEQVLAMMNQKYHVYHLKDYLTIPKINCFQGLSLYIDCFEPSRPIRIEVSTEEMQLVNDYGYAGLYILHKEVSQTFFIQALQKISDKYHEDKEFFESVNKNLLVEQIKIYTPKKEVIWIPINSTVKDFAYEIHSNVGKTAVGAYVNGELVDIDFILNDGDMVEVITRENRKAHKGQVRRKIN